MNIDIKEDVGFAMSLLKLQLKSKLEAQGHGRRGVSKLIDSIDYEIESTATIMVAGMYMEDYYIFVEKGVKASRIPYYPGSGRKTSKYIQGLIRFWRLKKGLSPRAAKRAAFATANKHKKEGMPSRSSFKFSKDGTRLGFLDSTLKKYENQVFEILDRRIGDKVELAFTDILNDISVQFKR